MHYTVTVHHAKGTATLYVEEGASLYVAMRNEKIGLPAPCGGRCLCGKCRIVVNQPAHTIPTAEEMKFLSPADVEQGFRLACAVRVQGDMTITVEDRMGGAKIMTDGEMGEMVVRNDIECDVLELESSSLEDQRSDADRLCEAAAVKTTLPLAVLRELPSAVRKDHGRVTVIHHGKRMLDVRAGQDMAVYGLAVDIGTTTLAAYLLDLDTGKQLAVASAMNPQKIHGDDVITRVDYARQDRDSLFRLQSMVMESINQMLMDMCKKAGISSRSVIKAAFVGNTVMMHLFAAVDPEYIALAPFIPAFDDAMCLKAAELGLHIHPEAMVWTLPCVASYVGADTIGAILASGVDRRQEISLLVDIGTNGEIALGSRDGLLACSTAAGPAFEGAHIRHGMGGVSGAINHVELTVGGLSYTTIGDAPARGICGSGIVDAVAVLVESGILDMTGRIEIENAPDALKADLIEEDRGPALVLARKEDGAEEDIVICQKDIREVQLAKGSVAAGIEVLMKELGIHEDRIAQVYLAGGFGSYIDQDNACIIGLLPPSLQGRIKAIGNGAGAGAKMALLSHLQLRRAEEAKRMVRYIELSSRPDFQDIFVDKMMFEEKRG